MLWLGDNGIGTSGSDYGVNELMDMVFGFIFNFFGVVGLLNEEGRVR